MDFFDPYNYFFELPLYSKIKTDSHSIVRGIIYFDSKINAYNPAIKENTTYEIKNDSRFRLPDLREAGSLQEHNLICVRTKKEYKVFSWFEMQLIDVLTSKYDYSLTKIGQYPSIADFHISKIKDYDKVLSKEKLKEFTRAVGLAANGVGIGSFVYLRRIFESLIEEAHIKAKTVSGWDETEFQRNSMSEKIGLLSHELPEFLVENKSIYGILSKGVHELSENECLQYFEPLKAGIELMLDEKVEKYEKQEKLKKARQSISSINSKLANESK